MITAVIFDMDGVIADSEYFNVKAKHLILQKAGIEVDCIIMISFWVQHMNICGQK